MDWNQFIDFIKVLSKSSSGIAAASNPFQVVTWKADSRIAFTASPMAFSSLACTSSFLGYLGCKETTAVPPENKTDKLPTNLTKPERQHPLSLSKVNSANKKQKDFASTNLPGFRLLHRDAIPREKPQRIKDMSGDM